MEKKLNFKVCGLPAKYFIPFFIIVMATVYLGFMPVVKIYSNDAGKYMATSFIMTIAYLMAVGGLFFWLGNTIPIVNNYLGVVLGAKVPVLLVSRAANADDKYMSIVIAALVGSR